MNKMEEVVKLVLHKHPKDCVFTPNALELILKELEHLNIDEGLPEKVIDAIVAAIQRQEIYCPREGIDKRDQFNEDGTPRL